MIMQSATILGSEVRDLKSVHTGREYRITISLPYAYHQPWPTGFPTTNALTQWPVVYLLDANWFYGMVTDITRNMAWCGRTTDAIVVGIGYPTDGDMQNQFLEVGARRRLDLLPVRDEAQDEEWNKTCMRPSPSGDAAGFHQFLRDELIPLIEKDYRADPARRVLVGHSYAGLFGAFALLHEPELFDAYVVASPSLWVSNRWLFKQEEAYFQEHKRLKTRVYLSAAEWEDRIVTGMFDFAAVLGTRNYEGLTLIKQYFANMNHCEVVAPAFHAGLLWALSK